ncbi:GNAT family N-acetyltransferase [Maritalea sp.]|uniref:GNAT family N-acetyltransferase n=1 Tax=Maritalea sp. TaxID=2003361 RepID=UPI003EF77150
MSAQFYADAMARNQIMWVAEMFGEPVGFLRAKPVDDLLYCAEVSVLRQHQSKQIGKKLLNNFAEFAKSNGFAGISGITFENVPWNAPYYARLGFGALPAADLGEELRQIMASDTEQSLAKAGKRVVFGTRF